MLLPDCGQQSIGPYATYRVSVQEAAQNKIICQSVLVSDIANPTVNINTKSRGNSFEMQKTAKLIMCVLMSISSDPARTYVLWWDPKTMPSLGCTRGQKGLPPKRTKHQSSEGLSVYNLPAGIITTTTGRKSGGMAMTVRTGGGTGAFSEQRRQGQRGAREYPQYRQEKKTRIRGRLTATMKMLSGGATTYCTDRRRKRGRIGTRKERAKRGRGTPHNADPRRTGRMGGR